MNIESKYNIGDIVKLVTEEIIVIGSICLDKEQGLIYLSHLDDEYFFRDKDIKCKMVEGVN